MASYESIRPGLVVRKQRDVESDPEPKLSSAILALGDVWDAIDDVDPAANTWRPNLPRELVVAIMRWVDDVDLAYVAMASWEMYACSEYVYMKRNTNIPMPLLDLNIMNSLHANMEAKYIEEKGEIPEDASEHARSFIESFIGGHNAGVLAYEKYHVREEPVFIDPELLWRAVARNRARVDEADRLRVVSDKTWTDLCCGAAIENNVAVIVRAVFVRNLDVDWAQVMRKAASAGNTATLYWMQSVKPATPDAHGWSITAATRAGRCSTITALLSWPAEFSTNACVRDGMDLCPPAVLQWMTQTASIGPEPPRTAIYAATRRGRHDLLAWAVEGPLSEELAPIVKSPTAITPAAMQGHLDILMWLRDIGTDIPRTFCFTAVSNAHWEVADWLFASGTGNCRTSDFFHAIFRQDRPLVLAWVQSSGYLVGLPEKITKVAAANGAALILGYLELTAQLDTSNPRELWLAAAASCDCSVLDWLNDRKWARDVLTLEFQGELVDEADHNKKTPSIAHWMWTRKWMRKNMHAAYVMRRIHDNINENINHMKRAKPFE